MRLRALALLCCMASSGSVLVRANAPAGFDVDIAASTAELRTNGAAIRLTVRSRADTRTPVRLHVRLVDPSGLTLAEGEAAIVTTGRYALASVEVDGTKITSGWTVETVESTRVTYEIRASGATGEMTEGIVALSRIVTESFKVSLLTEESVLPGKTHTVHVFASSIATSKPVRGASVRVALNLDADQDATFERVVRTDRHGTARVHFSVPDVAGLDGGSVEVSARQGALRSEASAHLEIHSGDLALLISTDKSIYQPGQTLHARVLAVGRDRRAAAKTDVRFKVKDESGETVFARTLTTSRFGVASADIPLADDAPLGDYEIEATVEREAGSDDSARSTVIVSRYDLPTFTVSAATDRPYYLPGEHARVTVSANYLFGKPVPGGRVRIRAFDEDSWNRRTNADDDDEGPVLAEGTCGLDGAFESALDLTEAMDALTRERWNDYRDASFVASVTDPSTNRTEERRFDVRTTRAPIHVAVTGLREVRAGESTSFFVITSRADGTVVGCDVTVSEAGPRIVAPDGSSRLSWIPIARVRTSKFGVASVRNVRLHGEPSARYRGLDIRVDATDGAGLEGSTTESAYVSDSAVVTVDAVRSVLAAGDPIEARVRTSSAASALMVGTVRDGQLLESAWATLRDGHGAIQFPYRPEYRGRVSVIAIDPTVRDNGWYSSNGTDSSGVLYPNDPDIEVAIHPERDTYSPGESLAAAVRVRDGSGRRAESVLAVTAVDASVTARLDSIGRYANGGLRVPQWWGLADGGRIGDVTLSSLNRRDPSRRVSPELDIVAAALLSNAYEDLDIVEVATRHATPLERVFKSAIEQLRRSIDSALIVDDSSPREHPDDEQSLAEALEFGGVNFEPLADPWGSRLVVSSRVDGPYRVLTVSSAGPDATPGTVDDLLVTQKRDRYFRAAEARISAAIAEYTVEPGRFVLDEPAFRAAMASAGIDASVLMDEWKKPYAPRFSASGGRFFVELESAGPDGRFGPESQGGSDDFVIARVSIDCYARRTATLQAALDRAAGLGSYPTDVSTWNSALAAAGIDPASLVDPYGSAPETSFARKSRYRNRVTFSNTTVFGSSAPAIRTTTTPVTEEFDEILLTSRGADRYPGTMDDVLLAQFEHVRSTTSATDPAPVPLPASIVFPVSQGIGGSIAGTVTDPQGSVIAGATVLLLDRSQVVLAVGLTDSNGCFAFRNLTPGRYTVSVEASGFTSATVELVPVSAGTTTQVDLELSVAGASEAVSVVGASDNAVELSSSSTTVTRREVHYLPPDPRRGRNSGEPEGADAPVRSTPRLRQYFPETVYWNPEIVTDRNGRARIEFPLADSITTWQLSVLASTQDGRIALGTADVLAFQPFFIDHDPPRVLTEGDRIGLPVVVRNYLDKAQSVDLSIEPAPWFAIDGPASRKVRVGASQSSRQVFDVRTTASVDDGAQRVTGLGTRASDAIEKPVDVHPDGEERIVTSSGFVQRTGVLGIRLPDDALGSPQTKLKIYPSPMAHVVESVEGIMKRPYGCGEQTISSSYPSLLLLEKVPDGLEPRLEATARKFLRAGYERLKSYRAADGGIGYWADSPSNTALTAYALRFLLDADGVFEVDPAFVTQLRDYLVKAQKPDGRWEAPRWYSTGDRVRDAVETGYVASILARVQQVPAFASDASRDAIRRALAFAAPIASSIDEPYLTASIALAAMDIGDAAMADDAVARLVATARAEGAAAYWTIETNTPFYGWGAAGRIETTARVVRALARHAGRSPAGASAADSRSLADRGTLFLLERKDRYGVWYSTQATVSVLDCLLEQVGGSSADTKAERSISVAVDGRTIAVAGLPAASVVSAPVEVDLSAAIGAGEHSIELTGSDDSKILAQIVARHFVPWVDAGRDPARPNHAEKREAALRLSVGYDRLDAPVGAQVTCAVTAERVGSLGYGMLVAEVGLPPGNDVDRASLDRAVANSGWTVCRYDVLPDRVVVYLWPKAGGTSFSFRFTTRYAIDAMAAPSSVYDYYNPESNVVLQPPKFRSAE